MTYPPHLTNNYKTIVLHYVFYIGTGCKMKKTDKKSLWTILSISNTEAAKGRGSKEGRGIRSKAEKTGEKNQKIY